MSTFPVGESFGALEFEDDEEDGIVEADQSRGLILFKIEKMNVSTLRRAVTDTGKRLGKTSMALTVYDKVRKDGMRLFRSLEPMTPRSRRFRIVILCR